MKVIKSEPIGADATGKDFYRCIIVSETAPDSFPTSGADVDGVPDTAGIAAGSVLLTPDGNSVLYADGWSEGGGGREGLLSVTIAPPITCEPSWDALPLPLYVDSSETQETVFLELIDPFDADEYSVTVTPTANWYAFYGETAGEKGEPVTYSVAVMNGSLFINADVASQPTYEAAEIDVVSLGIRIA